MNSETLSSLASVCLPQSTLERRGRIVRAVGTSLRASGLSARIGQRVVIQGNSSTEAVYADVVGLEDNHLLLYPLGSIEGISSGASVRLLESTLQLGFSASVLGRVLNGLGQDMNNIPMPPAERVLPLNAAAPNPLLRAPIDSVFTTGIRCIDTLLTIGEGQRTGIFAPAGAGKSTLLSMLAKSASADVIVIALIGERGREVREFIDENLSMAMSERAVMIVSTSDRPAMERVQAARVATAIAEGFRAEGKKVLLLMDSVTRYARALREIGLAIGEPAVRNGFPPSVFADLPKLFERAGNDDIGSITAFYTVLTEDEESIDPIAEETRSILDGHIVLSRKLGESGHYPAIDVLASTSRLFLSLASSEQQQDAVNLRKLLSKYLEVEFLVQVGEYVEGTDNLADDAIRLNPAIENFLKQSHLANETLSASLLQLSSLFSE